MPSPSFPGPHDIIPANRRQGLSMNDTSRRDPFYAVCLAALVLLWAGVALHVAGDMVWGTDDAYITYRYARNLAQGHGLVFNPGERVEGCSTLLYALLMTPAFFVFGDAQIYFFSLALNVLLVSAALCVYCTYVRRRLSPGAAAVAALLFAVSPFMWRTTANGMETALVLLIQLLIWIAVTQVTAGLPRQTGVLCAAFALSILARADGFVAPVIAVAYLLFRRRYRAAFAGLAVAAATLGAYVAWRYAYYGYLLPNTYYAKVAGPLAVRFEGAFAHLRLLTLSWGFWPSALGLAAPLLGVTVWAVGASWRGADRRFSLGALAANALPTFRGPAARVAAAVARPFRFLGEKGLTLPAAIPFETFFACGWIAYWHYIGGDFVGVRFLLFLFPLGTCALLERLAPLLRKRMALAAVCAGLVLIQLTPLATNSHFDYSFRKFDGWRQVGEFLRDHHAGKTVALDAAGKMPFYSGLYTIDMLGLNDEYIAHQPVRRADLRPGHSKWDTQYVLERRPDLIAAFHYIDASLQYGLTPSAYEAAGYRLAYVAYLKPPGPGTAPILDVRGLPQEEQAERLRAEMSLGILERIAP